MTQSVSTDDIKNQMKANVLALLQRPTQEKKKKQPHNKLWIAYLGFNGVMFGIDLISAITVGALTSPLYGVLTFLAGFLALLLHENLFTNPFANQTQKNIAIGGGLIAILSTMGIGVLAAIANVLNLATMVSGLAVEMGTIISLVAIAGLHGILWGCYFFMDEGHQAAMKAMVNAAWRTQQRKNFEESKEDVRAAKEIHAEINALGDDVTLLDAAFKQNTGRSLLGEPAAAPVIVSGLIPADPQMPFIPDARKYPSETKLAPLYNPVGPEQLADPHWNPGTETPASGESFPGGNIQS
jgi:hypothetical protein